MRKFFQRFRISLWLLGALIVLPPLSVVFWLQSFRIGLTDARAEIEATNPFAEIRAQPPLTRNDNAYTYLSQLGGMPQKANEQLRPIYMAEDDYEIPLKPEVQTQTDEVCEKYAKMLALYSVASRCSGSVAPVDEALGWTRSPDYALEAGWVRGLLGLKARTHISRGELDDALRVGISMLRVAAHLERDPQMLSYLPAVGTRRLAIELVNDAIRSGPTSPDLRREIDELLAEADTLDVFVRMIQGEAVLGMYSIWLMNRGELKVVGNNFRETDERFSPYWLCRSYNESAYLEMMSTAIRIAPGPRQGWKTLNRDLISGGTSLTAGLTPSPWLNGPMIVSLRDHADRNRASVRCLRVLLASLQDGEVPEEFSLEQLKLPPSVLVDPFDDQQLRLKFTDEGPYIYSVGNNQVDDDGKIYGDRNEDVGLGPHRRKEEKEEVDLYESMKSIFK